MIQIPIKIEKNEFAPKNTPPKETPAPELKKPASKKKIWLISLLIIVLAAAAVLSFLIFQRTKGLEKILPQNSAAVISFNKTETEKIFLYLEEKNWLWPPLGDLKKTGQNFLTENQIDLQKVSESFNEKMVLGLLENDPNNFGWLAAAQIKIGSSDFERGLAEIKKNLDRKFNIFSEAYRQTEIWQIKTLSGQNPPIFYASLKNYFLVASNQDITERAIDRILKIK